MSPSIRRIALVLCVVGLAAASGCLGGQSAATETATTSATASLSTATTTQPTDAQATTTDDTPARGTEFVSVSRLQNQSSYTEWPDDESVRFANLSKAQQATFRTALEDGRVTFAPDETNPFAFNDKRRPRLVRYDGTWYYVRVAIV